MEWILVADVEIEEASLRRCLHEFAIGLRVDLVILIDRSR